MFVFLVCNPAILSYFTGAHGERAQVPHPDHGVGEVAEEKRHVTAVSLHQRPGRGVIAGVQPLVRGQQPPFTYQIREVMLVEHVHRVPVERRSRVVVAALRAEALQLRRHVRLQRHVVAGEPVFEQETSRQPDRVPT